jgi:CRISPR/Cas system-associated exonuclease Cas4 (RecB family)
VPSTRALIHAPWSASKVSTALRCPRLFHFKYVEKVAEPEVMPEAKIGKAIHAVLEDVLQGKPLEEAQAVARATLTTELEQVRFDRLGAGIVPFTDRIDRFRKRRRVKRQLVEYAIAVREDLSTTQFYAGDAYYRGVLDLAYQFEDDSIALVDHKTGVRHPGTTIADQMVGYAVLAAMYFNRSRRFWLGLHWVPTRIVEWSAPMAVTEIRGKLVPDLLDTIEAAALSVDDGPRPNAGPWCEVCSYRSICPASREQRFEPVEYYEDDED